MAEQPDGYQLLHFSLDMWLLSANMNADSLSHKAVHRCPGSALWPAERQPQDAERNVGECGCLIREQDKVQTFSMPRGSRSQRPGAGGGLRSNAAAKATRNHERLQSMQALTIDGSYGEGGGQILRTALSLSVMTVRPFRLINIRAGRRNPGLLPQHLSAVRAAAAIGGAAVSGDQLASTELSFAPSHPAQPGQYVFDVAETARRGSAGSVTLVSQVLLVPLALADSTSHLLLRGGTHVEWSPPFDDLANSYVPALQRMGLAIEAKLKRFGWYPIGGGEIVCDIGGRSTGAPRPIEMVKRGPLRRISARAIAANLPAHIPQRMKDRAQASLAYLNVPVDVEPQLVTAAGPGAGIFLSADYQDWPASFSSYGRLGRPSEAVADQAVAALREHDASEAAVEVHLADQLLLPLAVARGVSRFTTLRPSGHLMTNAWTIRQFGVADVSIAAGPPCEVRIEPQARH